MAGRPKNRMELRRQYEAAEPPDPIEQDVDDVTDEVGDDDEERRPKCKAKVAKKAAKPKSRAKAAKPAARMKVVWVVVNDAFKPVATFEFNQREAADAKAAEMTARGKGTHFVQRVKEAMAEDAPGLAPRFRVRRPRPLHDRRPRRPPRPRSSSRTKRSRMWRRRRKKRKSSRKTTTTEPSGDRDAVIGFYPRAKPATALVKPGRFFLSLIRPRRNRRKIRRCGQFPCAEMSNCERSRDTSIRRAAFCAARYAPGFGWCRAWGGVVP